MQYTDVPLRSKISWPLGYDDDGDMKFNKYQIWYQYHIVPFHSLKVLLTILTTVKLSFKGLFRILNMTIRNKIYQVIMLLTISLTVPYHFIGTDIYTITYRIFSFFIIEIFVSSCTHYWCCWTGRSPQVFRARHSQAQRICTAIGWTGAAPGQSQSRWCWR